jgi:hypothetical protein
MNLEARFGLSLIAEEIKKKPGSVEGIKEIGVKIPASFDTES